MEVGTVDVVDVGDGTTVDAKEVMVVVGNAFDDEEAVVVGVHEGVEVVVGGGVEVDVTMSLL